VATLAPFPGMRHLDVAGGTGDVAFRVLRAIRAAEAVAAAPASLPPGREPGRVVLCDINAAMLEEGRRKAADAPDLAGGWCNDAMGAGT
jgi:2-methoxy-6-polyprenyl-1,4-benzoquinol methylase